MRLNQLLEVLVPGHNYNVDSLLCSLSGECANDVICFVPFQGEDRNAIGFQQLTDALHACVEVLLELPRQLFSCCLVLGEHLVPEAESRVMHPAEVVRLMRSHEALNEVRNTPGSRGILPPRSCQRARNQCEERTIDERIAVHEKESRASGTRCAGWLRKRGISHVRTIAGKQHRLPLGQAVEIRDSRQLVQATRWTLAACSPLAPAWISNSTS